MMLGEMLGGMLSESGQFGNENAPSLRKIPTKMVHTWEAMGGLSSDVDRRMPWLFWGLTCR